MSKLIESFYIIESIAVLIVYEKRGVGSIRLQSEQ